MKTSNKILLIAYAVLAVALSTMIFATRPMVERVILGTETSLLVK